MKIPTEVREGLDSELQIIFLDHDDLLAKITEPMKERALQKAAQIITNYIHSCGKKLPKGVYFIWVDMAVDILKNMLPSIFEELYEANGQNEGKISSIKVGDTSLGLTRTDTVKDSVNLENALLGTYAAQLKSFRRMAGCCCEGTAYDVSV